jgi:hypothetical protein
MFDSEADTSVFSETHNDANRFTSGKAGLLLSIGVSAAFGMLGGLLLGRKTGEARGLAAGRELGRLEAATAMTQPRLWRRWWRREAAA